MESFQGRIDWLIERGAAWVRSRRARFFSIGKELTGAMRLRLSLHFARETLNSVRLVDVACIENPDFYKELLRAGLSIPIDLTRVAAITYVDTVLLSKARRPPDESRPSLIFHELVHAVQYASLGVDEFIGRYVRGWAANGFVYEDIPLERQAYELESAFDAGKIFSVEERVAQRLAEGSGVR